MTLCNAEPPEELNVEPPEPVLGAHPELEARKVGTCVLDKNLEHGIHADENGRIWPNV